MLGKYSEFPVLYLWAMWHPCFLLVLGKGAAPSVSLGGLWVRQGLLCSLAVG